MRICTLDEENIIATPTPMHRNDNNDQNKAADEATRTARTVTDEAARVGEQTARAGADVFRRSTETARESVQSGLNTATQTVQRMTDQFTQVLGFTGPQSEELARRSSQNLQAVTQASTVLARGAQEVSQEVFGLVQDRLQKNVEAVNRIVGTRSVQDFVSCPRFLWTPYCPAKLEDDSVEGKGKT